MTQTLETGKKTTLSKVCNPWDTVMDLATAPTITKGRGYLFNWSQEEWFSYDGIIGNQLQNVVRWLSTTAIPATAGTGLKWIAGTRVKFVAMHDQLVDRGEDINFAGDIVFAWDVTSNLTFKPPRFASVAARNAAIPTPEDGMLAATAGDLEHYNGWTAQWETADTGTPTPNASETVKGSVEIATKAQRATSTSIGETGAILVPSNDALVKSSSWAADEDKIPILDAAGKLAIGFMANGAEAIFGNGSDWVQWDSDLTITGSNNTFITKNFTSWTAGSVARTCTVTPTNCVVWIKIQWNADFTNWTFNFAGKWWPWGAQQTGGTGNVWAVGNSTNYTVTANWAGGVLWASSAAWGVAWAKLSASLNTSLFYIDWYCWAGGGSWGSNSQSGTYGWIWGAWGAGWGGLIITVGWNVVFTSSALTVAGSSWSNGTNGTGGASGGWGGWGGWGGTAAVLYRGTATGTLTPTVSGWAAWSGGTGAGTTAGAGWGWGGSLCNAGTNGASTSSASTWGAGWVWGAGVSIVQKI